MRLRGVLAEGDTRSEAAAVLVHGMDVLEELLDAQRHELLLGRQPYDGRPLSDQPVDCKEVVVRLAFSFFC